MIWAGDYARDLQSSLSAWIVTLCIIFLQLSHLFKTWSCQWYKTSDVLEHLATLTQLFLWLWISGNLHCLTKHLGVLKLEPLGNSTTETVVIINPVELFFHCIVKVLAFVIPDSKLLTYIECFDIWTESRNPRRTSTLLIFNHSLAWEKLSYYFLRMVLTIPSFPDLLSEMRANLTYASDLDRGRHAPIPGVAV